MTEEDDAPRHYCEEVLADVGLEPASEDAEHEKAIDALAELSLLAYERRRVQAADELGIPVTRLDTVVKKHRLEIEAEAEAPPLYLHWTVEPWAEPVAGDVLLRALMERIRRHVVMSPNQALAVALWIMLTWVHETAAVHSPLLLVTSPEPNSGKSTLLGLIGFLARRGLLSVSITGPALFRSIEKWGPTFVTDEGDTVLANNEDLKEVINSGWTRGQSAIRCDPETNEPRPYSTFCPKAIGMKGRKLPDTTLSRAIVIEMKRKRPDEVAADFYHVDDDGLARLRRQLARWAQDHAAALAKAEPEIPPGFHNRTRANWKLMFAIAEAADHKKEAWQAAGRIEDAKATFEASIGVTLLAAIRAMFDDESDIDCLLSKDIIDNLTADPEAPWADYKRGNKITQRQLALLLKEYQIRPTTVHPPDRAHGKGYQRRQFDEVFATYLTPLLGKSTFDPCKRANVDDMGTSRDFRSVREGNAHGSKNGDLSSNDAGLHGCTDRKPENGGDRNHPTRRCDQCGWPSTPADPLQRWPWPCRPEGVWLHRGCQHEWFDGEYERSRATRASTTRAAENGSGGH